jgi:thioredoxin-related protein
MNVFIMPIMKGSYGMKMKAAAIVILVSMMSFSVPAQTPHKEVMLEWSAFEKGLSAAKAENKKVLIDVYTDWCSWCKKMDANVYANPQVRDYLKSKYITIKVNAEGSGNLTYNGSSYTPPQLAANFGVTGYPATLFLKSSGEPITLLPGYVEPDMMMNILSFIAEDKYATMSFENYLKEKAVKKK